MQSPPRILVVAGTDPLGGAGTVADALTIADFGAVACCVETCIVDQDSHGVHGVAPLDTQLVIDRTRRVLADARPAAIKLGMLFVPETIDALAELLTGLSDPAPPVILDPVLAAGARGDSLAARGALAALRTLLSACSLVTPNTRELAALGDFSEATGYAEAVEQARQLAARYRTRVLAKGGHLPEVGADALVDSLGVHEFPPAGDWGVDIHGTGCMLSSAIAAGVAHGLDFVDAVKRARVYMSRAVDAGRFARVGGGRPQFVHPIPADDLIPS